jgi:hypothetical protein
MQRRVHSLRCMAIGVLAEHAENCENSRLDFSYLSLPDLGWVDGKNIALGITRRIIESDQYDRPCCRRESR